MLQSVEAVHLPAPGPNDDEDTAWALSTAHAMWNRGERSEAVKWLRRAAEAASEVEADDRALELAKAAAELTGQISLELHESAPPPAVNPSAPPPTSMAAVPLGEPMFAAPARAPDPVAPLDESSSLVAAEPAPPASEIETTLLGPPVYLGLEPSPASTAQPLTPTFGMLAASPASPGFLSPDATSPMTATFSDSGRDKGGVPARTSQALHAAIYRDETGKLRVAPHGSTVPLGAMAVIIVAVDPSSDLGAL